MHDRPRYFESAPPRVQYARMAKPEVTSVAQYVTAQPAHVRRALERVRATIRKTLPGAVEGIAYQMPIYKVDGRMVLYYAGYAKHYAIYPATPAVIDALGDALGDAAADLLHSKATLRFGYEGEVPTALIALIAKVRAAEVAAEGTSRATARTIAKPRGGKGTAKAAAPKRTTKASAGKRTTKATAGKGTTKAAGRKRTT